MKSGFLYNAVQLYNRALYSKYSLLAGNLGRRPVITGLGPQPCSQGSIPTTWVTFGTGDMGNTLARVLSLLIGRQVSG
jgi:hypothetical protein